MTSPPVPQRTPARPSAALPVSDSEDEASGFQRRQGVYF